MDSSKVKALAVIATGSPFRTRMVEVFFISRDEEGWDLMVHCDSEEDQTPFTAKAYVDTPENREIISDYIERVRETMAAFQSATNKQAIARARYYDIVRLATDGLTL